MFQQILQKIYDIYYNDFCAFDHDETIRNAKVFVPIDCQKIAKKLGTNGDIVFGRLYYHLANKHKYTVHDNGSAPIVRLFEFKVGKHTKCVNFPFMASVLADLKIQDRRFKLTLSASVLALCISVVSLAFTSFDKFSAKPTMENVELKYNKALKRN